MKKKIMYHPPQLDSIAADFDQAASRVRDISSNVQRVKPPLDETWFCARKNAFDMEFSSMPSRFEEIANALRRRADEIRQIQVEIEIDVPEGSSGL